MAEQARPRPGDNIVVPPTPWEDTVTADQAVLLDAWLADSATRWVLTASEHTAYLRLRNTILHDTLDRYAMG